MNRISLFQISWFVAVGLLLVLPASTPAQTVVTTIPLGAAPGPLVVNPVNNKIYVTTCSPHRPQSLTVIDGQTNAITAIPGICPIALAVNPVTNKIYAVDPGSGILIIDGATNSTTTIANPHNSVAVAVNSTTNKIYLANASSDTNPSASVAVLDGATNSIATIVDPNTSGLGAIAIAVNSATNRIYVANNSIEAGTAKPGNITVIDGATNSTTTLTDPNAIFPFSVAVNSATNKVYVANIGEGTNHGNVTVIDGTTNSFTTVTDPNALLLSWTNGREFAVAVNSATNKIYVANADSNNVTIIDGVTNSTATVTDPNAVAPIALAVDSVANMIYVTNTTNPGSVTVINGAGNAVTTVIDPNAGSPNAVAANPTTNKIYVNGGDNITVIDGGVTPTSRALLVKLVGNGNGTVTSNPAGIDCDSGPFCTASFADGTAVGLTASPSSGSVFSGWSTNCAGTGTCNVKMTSDDFVGAAFNLIDFSITPASATLVVQQGGQVTEALTIVPQNGFSNPVQLSCALTGSTPLATCSLSPTSVTPGANSVTSTLTVTAPSQSARLILRGKGQLSSPLYAVFLPIPLTLIGLGLAGNKSKNRTRSLWLLCSFFVATLVLQAGCGGGSSNQKPSPALNYTVTVTATSGALQHTNQVNVTIQ